MLLRLLLCCALVRGAEACLPMQPGELPCPSKPPTFTPENKDPTKTTTYPLDKPMVSMGNTIYSCPYGTLVSSDETQSKPGEGATIVCKPDSGFFLLKEADGKEKQIPAGVNYGCIEKLCPPLPDINSPKDANAPYMGGGAIMSKDEPDKKVASCKDGEALYSVDAQGNAMLVEEAKKPACKRNTATWSPVDKIYRCLSKNCATAQKATNDVKLCPPLFTCSPAMVTGDLMTEVKCPPMSVVSYASTEDSVTFVQAPTITCDKGTGKWKGGSNELVETPFVTCAKDSMCRSCTDPKLLKPTDAACQGTTGKFCQSEPKVSRDPGMCYMIKCDDLKAKVSVVNADKTMTLLSESPICKDGVWKSGGVDVVFKEGVVCSKDLDCKECGDTVSGLYDTTENSFIVVKKPDNDLPTGTTCTYTCENTLAPTTIQPDFKTYDSVTCDIKMGDKAQFNDGTTLSKWSCKACQCPTGRTPACSPFKECADPPTPNNCVYECPDETTPYYRGKDMMLHMAPPGKFRCSGKTFLEIADYDSELQCVSDKSAGTVEIPDNSICDKLVEPNPAVPGSTFGNIRYTFVDATGDTKATCTEGVLYVVNEPIEALEVICYAGTTSFVYPQATCLNDPKLGMGAACLAKFPEPDFKYECKIGICTATCTNPQKQMKVKKGGVSENVDGAMCLNGEEPVKFDSTSFDTAECA